MGTMAEQKGLRIVGADGDGGGLQMLAHAKRPRPAPVANDWSLPAVGHSATCGIQPRPRPPHVIANTAFGGTLVHRQRPSSLGRPRASDKGRRFVRTLARALRHTGLEMLTKRASARGNNARLQPFAQPLQSRPPVALASFAIVAGVGAVHATDSRSFPPLHHLVSSLFIRALSISGDL